MRILTCVLIAVLSVLAAPAGAEKQAPNRRVVEIRSYNLKPGARDRFHQVVVKEAMPMLRRWKMDVVSFGPSLHDQTSYFLIRAFSSVEQRQKEEDAFYGSEEWIKGPRERILAEIESYTTVVMPMDDATLEALRRVRTQ